MTDESPDRKTPSKHLRRAIRIAIVLAVIGLGVWVWEDVLKDRLIAKRWGVVEEGRIYRSGQLHRSLVRRTLAAHDIKVVIDLTGPIPDDPDQQAEAQAAERLGIDRVRYPLGGNGTGKIEHYAGAVARIVRARRAGEPVLVHCAAGSQRTGGVIACYRMLIEKRSGRFAVEEMQRYDWDPDKDTDVLNYVNDNMAELARLLKDMGALDAIPDPLPRLPDPAAD